MRRILPPAVGLVAALVLLDIVGCTPTPSRAPDSVGPSPTGNSISDSHLPLSGGLVSQGAATQGTVSLIPNGDEFAIVLSGFSTRDAGDLRIHLSTGPLVTGSDGYQYVDDQNELEMPGTIDPSDPSQIFVFPIAFWPAAVRTFTVYNYADRLAYGSASLEPAAVSLPPWASAPITVVDSGTRPGATGGASPSSSAVQTYTIAPGDTASDIAARFDVGVEQLIDENDVRLGRYPELQPFDRIRFGTPLTGKTYDCFFGTIPSQGKAQSCYD
jgi:hypothetical protein